MGKSSLFGSSYSLCTMAATSYTPPFAFRGCPAAGWRYFAAEVSQKRTIPGIMTRFCGSKIFEPLGLKKGASAIDCNAIDQVRGGGCPKGGRRGSLRYLSPTASRSSLVRGGLPSLHKLGSLPLGGRWLRRRRRRRERFQIIGKAFLLRFLQTPTLAP